MFLRQDFTRSRFLIGCLFFACLVLLLGLQRGWAVSVVDTNGNGMSDVWELLHGSSGLDPDADADGDGISNREESIAGTDPLDPASFPVVSALSLQGTNLFVRIPIEVGKRYLLQSRELMAGANWSEWADEAEAEPQMGSEFSFTIPLGSAVKLFRVSTSDLDSDGDGLSDWEEHVLGLDPMNATSNGTLDSSGKLVGDLAFATDKLARQETITLRPVDVAANQPDPGQVSQNPGLIELTRDGFPLTSVTVTLGLGPSGPGKAAEGVDYAQVPRSVLIPAGVSSVPVEVVPLANTNLRSPVLATLKVLPGAGYHIGSPDNATVVIVPSTTPTGSGLTGEYFTNSSSTYTSTVNFNPAQLIMTRVDPVIDFTWGTATNPIVSSGYYCVRWTGQVQPQYSEKYYFVANTDDGLKLWVNDQLIIDRWASKSASDVTGTITLQGGVRYNIRLEYFNRGGGAAAHLSWYSPSQPKQVIPATRLYPSALTSGGPAITSSLTAVAFLGQPFTFAVTAANSGNSTSATGLPSGLAFDSAQNLIAGTPTVAGHFQVLLTVSSGNATGASVLELEVIDTGSSVVREVWTGVPGTSLADIPLDQPPTSTSFLGTLQTTPGSEGNYAERVRGFFTAPVTGTYYFWLSGSDAAELWLSTDAEPVNKVRRAFVSPLPNPNGPPALGTSPGNWQTQPSQRSAWLVLAAGQKYYLEVLHKAGSGAGDHWGIGWSQDPVGTNSTPSGIVPGYVLSRFFPLPATSTPGTLYSANMLAQSGVISSGTGGATLRVNGDGTRAVLKFHYGGLSSDLTGAHIHSDAYLNSPSQIIFDIDDATPEADGSLVWQIAAIGTLSAADIQELIRQGKTYINLHTTKYPGGEINGHFTLASGAQSFSPPQPPPVWIDDHSNSNAAARFLIQASFGPSIPELAAVQAIGYEGWIEDQFSRPPTYHLSNVLANASSDPTRFYPGTLTFNTWWQRAVIAPDQLRQRVAFALSEIMVVSMDGVLDDNARALSGYYDILLEHAFGNYRELLEAVTLSPAMGIFLDMRANDKGNLVTGVHPNENYAREILQLFSIGLYRMWPDGTLVMDSAGELVPTYDQNVIMGFAGVFTGWNYHQTNQTSGRLPTSFSPRSNYTNAMTLVPTHHELGTKLLLDNVMLPAAVGSQADSSNPAYDAYGLNDLELSHDSICAHQNVGPFICRQLIQRLVTSHPSRDYLYRVVQKFNDNGAGIRGDMRAVVKAILLDYEARSSSAATEPRFGKQREPLLRVTAAARAFPGPAPLDATYSQDGGRPIRLVTATPHRLNSGDTVKLTFTDGSGQPVPPAQGYSVTVTNPSVFTVNAPGVTTGTYGQTNQVITVNLGSHGLATNYWVYLVFTSGSATNGVYRVVTVPDASHFTVATLSPTLAYGNCLFPRLTGGGYVQSGNTVTFSLPYSPRLSVVAVAFNKYTQSGSPADGTYTITAVPDATHFSITAANSATLTQNGAIVYPLTVPPLVRSGTARIEWSTWSMNTTDTGSSSSLSQSPLNSPTVFNFYFPDYKFPGALAAAGLTTPEFQITSDTTTAQQMNFLAGGILGNASNTNGLTSFASGNGAIVLDIKPYMTTGYTSNAGVPSLVDALNTLLCAGQLSGGAKEKIVSYVANTSNFPLSAIPTQTQMRERVRAVIHLIVISPEYTIQR